MWLIAIQIQGRWTFPLIQKRPHTEKHCSGLLKLFPMSHFYHNAFLFIEPRGGSGDVDDPSHIHLKLKKKDEPVGAVLPRVPDTMHPGAHVGCPGSNLCSVCFHSI